MTDKERRTDEKRIRIIRTRPHRPLSSLTVSVLHNKTSELITNEENVTYRKPLIKKFTLCR